MSQVGDPAPDDWIDSRGSGLKDGRIKKTSSTDRRDSNPELSRKNTVSDSIRGDVIRESSRFVLQIYQSEPAQTVLLKASIEDNRMERLE